MITREAAPRLRRGVKLRYDEARARWMLLGPERGFVLNATGLAIVRAFAAGHSLGTIAAELAAAEGDVAVADDVVAFVRDLCARGLCE